MIKDDQNLDKKTITLYSLHLAIGCIALWSAIPSIITYAIVGFELAWGLSTVPFFVLSFIWLIAGILLVITFFGFLFSKKYFRYTGILGCISFMLYPLILFIFISQPSINLGTIAYFFWYFLLPVVLIVLTLIYWKKLA